MISVLKIIFHLTPFSQTSLSLKECSTYKLLNESNRAETYNPTSFIHLCDRTLFGWYRFSGEAGFKMAEHCVSKGCCGTFAPGWLSGTHPTLAEGAVERKVCFHWSAWRSFCCSFSTFIKVRNCGKFYVYKLRPPPVCSLRYCGNGLFKKGEKFSNIKIHAILIQLLILF